MAGKQMGEGRAYHAGCNTMLLSYQVHGATHIKDNKDVAHQTVCNWSPRAEQPVLKATEQSKVMVYSHSSVTITPLLDNLNNG